MDEPAASQNQADAVGTRPHYRLESASLWLLGHSLIGFRQADRGNRFLASTPGHVPYQTLQRQLIEERNIFGRRLIRRTADFPERLRDKPGAALTKGINCRLVGCNSLRGDRRRREFT